MTDTLFNVSNEISIILSLCTTNLTDFQCVKILYKIDQFQETKKDFKNKFDITVDFIC